MTVIILLSAASAISVWLVISYLKKKNRKTEPPYLPGIGVVYGEDGNPFSVSRAKVLDVQPGEDGKFYVKYLYISSRGFEYELSCDVGKFNSVFRGLKKKK